MRYLGAARRTYAGRRSCVGISKSAKETRARFADGPLPALRDDFWSAIFAGLSVSTEADAGFLSASIGAAAGFLSAPRLVTHVNSNLATDESR